MRYFIKLAYKGTNYFGWQYQPDAISVQETLNKALSTLLKTNIDILGAGRTDSGVHAKEMFAHFDYETEIDIEKLVYKLNSFLPKDIAIFDLIKVHDEAHARFDATKRTYEYHIHTKKNAFKSDDSWYYSLPLDVAKMNEACKILFEYIDFECFSKTNTDVNTFNCKIFEANWQQNEDKLVFIIAADRFLRNMVRAIVGTMINIGSGKVSLNDFRQIIESKNRSKAGFSVPAHGLYLTKIEYPYLSKE
ncbi:tRNA pseudouridine(38-40) synthase TruA [Flavobacterium macrobrachii]|jgi:tRNA pseudouridine38-40 synthase|uniref:tRNA pseudouridine synthase A n=1 Tax=Flavobacterium macrobrachii TaxID=591204 RepID=A0ABS2CYW0_9FLAO|nr:tRNA pseudouridine(38-40) synthase TruA [Flavobacterium macrobrachii]MBM6499377.1 tRNA pseudouridine(38-40) synthase TruA [Flavobacterium macrobrachii]